MQPGTVHDHLTHQHGEHVKMAERVANLEAQVADLTAAIVEMAAATAEKPKGKGSD